MGLKEIRKVRGLTQIQVSEMSGVKQPHIARIEAGEGGVTLRVVSQIADALGVEPADIIDTRSQMEAYLIQAFRSLPADRQKGWIDMAEANSDPPRPSD